MEIKQEIEKKLICDQQGCVKIKDKDKETPKTSVPKPPLAYQIFQKQRIQKLHYIMERHKKTKLEAFKSLPSPESCTFTLPPLVFFVAHVNPSVFSLLTEHFPYLRELGYSRICFEHDNDKTLEEVIISLKKNHETFERDKKQFYTKDLDETGKMFFESGQIVDDYVIKPTLNFLQNVQTEASWLKYEGIDGPLTPYRTPEFAEILQHDTQLNEMREECFALTAAVNAHQSKGGTIMIMGYGHGEFQEKLEHFSPGACKNYVFFEFSPICEKRFLDEDTQRQIKETTFIHKPLVLDTSLSTEELSETFKGTLNTKIALMNSQHLILKKS